MNRTGCNARHWRATKDQRMSFGKAHAPLKVDPPNHQCHHCKKKTTLLKPSKYSSRRVCYDCWVALEWQSVKDMVAKLPETEMAYGAPELETKGYDPTCGLQPLDEWRRDFALAVLNDRIWCGMPEDPLDDTTRDLFGLAPTPLKPAVAPEKPVVKKQDIKEPRPASPIKKREPITNKKKLSLGHERILTQIGGNTDVPCPGCGLDLSPRYKVAAENGTCPTVFVYAKNNLAYCGPCYGKLAYYPDLALGKPVAVPVKG